LQLLRHRGPLFPAALASSFLPTAATAPTGFVVVVVIISAITAVAANDTICTTATTIAELRQGRVRGREEREEAQRRDVLAVFGDGALSRLFRRHPVVLACESKKIFSQMSLLNHKNFIS
jgi:hypothetical protein